MSNYDAILWLHLSDFHVGMDDYAQRKLFAEITSELKRRIDGGEGPDFVFITGDIANTGIKDQYNDFFESFIIDLIDALEENSEAKIFMVPGNHDVTVQRRSSSNLLKFSSQRLLFSTPLIPEKMHETSFSLGLQTTLRGLWMILRMIG